MPKALVVGQSPSGNYRALHPVLRMLKAWGFEPHYAYYESDTSLRPRHPQFPDTIDPTSTNARDFLRMFDVVLVFGWQRFSTTTTDMDATVRWLQYNEDADPPVVYFGVNLHASRTTVTANLPADFPIIRWDPADTTTFTPADTLVSSGTSTVFSVWDAGGSCGTAVRLIAEPGNPIVFVLAWSAYETSGTAQGHYFARLDMDKHLLLSIANFTWRGRTRAKCEILAVPDYPESAYAGGRTFAGNEIIAYRYAQHLWMPNSPAARFWRQISSQYGFWLPYALKLLGFTPKRPFPVYFETDHFIQWHSVGWSSHPNYPSYFEAVLNTYKQFWTWMGEFCRAKGTHIICGTYRSRAIGPTDADILDQETEMAPLSNSARAKGWEVIEVFRRYPDALPLTIHDHNYHAWGGGTRTNPTTTIVRHAGSERYPLGKPYDVRKRSGRVVHVSQVKTVPSDAIEVWIGGEKYYDLRRGVPEEMGGTGDWTAPHDHRDYHMARYRIERGEYYLREVLGVDTDGFAGAHRYTNTARNSVGGYGFVRALKEKGIRGIRAVDLLVDPDGPTQSVPASRVIEGMVVPFGRSLEFQGVSRGLFNPNSVNNWVQGGSSGNVNFNIGGDISTNWGTNYEAMAWRAYQRVITTFTMAWLGCAVRLEAPYHHPTNSVPNLNPNNPLADFDPSIPSLSAIVEGIQCPSFNYMKELFLNMDKIITVLSGWYKWGTVSEVMDRILEEADSL